MFQLPFFNLTVQIWDPPNDPTTAPPDRSSKAQFYFSFTVGFSIHRNKNDRWNPLLAVRCPMNTILLQDGAVVVPGGLSPFYRIRWVEPVHLGMSNEYVQAWVDQSSQP